MKKIGIYLVAALLLANLGGCAQYENKRGVFDLRQEDSAGRFVSGQTSRQEVLELLGPPSQVIALGDETVLYYLFEYSEGTGLVLIVYNEMRIQTHYDRAIFFFDAEDRLTDYSTPFASRDAQ